MNPYLPKTDLEGLKLVRRGKVRDVYEVDADRLLLVSSDRVSAFDYVLDPGIPFKGAVLNRISAWWFGQVAARAKTHFLTADVSEMPESVKRHAAAIGGRAALCRKAKIVPFECVVRGYLAGSAVKEYKERSSVCGEPLPAGLKPGDQLPQPIFTPTTKAEAGHDEPVTLADMETALGRDIAHKLKSLTIQLFVFATNVAREHGLILVDTKLEWGLDEKGELILCDEIFTPDSSRYWLTEEWKPGTQPDPLDKQVVRNYLLASPWGKGAKDKTPPPLPPGIVVETSRRYLRLYEILTGGPLE